MHTFCPSGPRAQGGLIGRQPLRSKKMIDTSTISIQCIAGTILVEVLLEYGQQRRHTVIQPDVHDVHKYLDDF